MTHPPTAHPPIDFEKLEIEEGRLERALTLTVQAFAAHPGAYAVTPVSEEARKHGIDYYAVDLRSPDVVRCTCADHTFAQKICKHMLACLLHENEPHVVAALREMTGKLERQLVESIARYAQKAVVTHSAPVA